MRACSVILFLANVCVILGLRKQARIHCPGEIFLCCGWHVGCSNRLWKTG